MQAIRCLSIYSGACIEFSENEAIYFSNFNFENLFQNSSFLKMQGIIVLLNNLIPRFKDEINNNILTESFLYNILELCESDDVETKLSIYRLFSLPQIKNNLNLIEILFQKINLIKIAENDLYSENELLQLYSKEFLRIFDSN